MVAEVPMRQLAWLDFYGWMWLLLNGNPKEPVRSWVFKDAAIAQLREEGWKISGPHPKRLLMKRDSRQRIYGYAMARIVH